VFEKLKVDPAAIGADLSKDCLYARRLDSRQTADADVTLDLFTGSVSDLVPTSKSPSQLTIARIAVCIRCILREDRINKYVDAAAPAFPGPRAVFMRQAAEDFLQLLLDV